MAKKKAKAAETGGSEQVGFHKGALTTLAKEREELTRLLQIVEQLMQMHIKGLKELGIDLEAEAQQPAPKAKSKPIDDIV